MQVLIYLEIFTSGILCLDIQLKHFLQNQHQFYFGQTQRYLQEVTLVLPENSFG